MDFVNLTIVGRISTDVTFASGSQKDYASFQIIANLSDEKKVIFSVYVFDERLRDLLANTGIGKGSRVLINGTLSPSENGNKLIPSSIVILSSKTSQSENYNDDDGEPYNDYSSDDYETQRQSQSSKYNRPQQYQNSRQQNSRPQNSRPQQTRNYNGYNKNYR